MNGRRAAMWESVRSEGAAESRRMSAAGLIILVITCSTHAYGCHLMLLSTYLTVCSRNVPKELRGQPIAVQLDTILEYLCRQILFKSMCFSTRVRRLLDAMHTTALRFYDT